MGKTKKYTNKYARHGSGVHEPTPKTGSKRYWYLVKTHFFRLLGINALFALFCIPIITIPASLSGMTNVLMKLTREGNCFIWQDFWEEFKTHFIERVCIWFGLQLIPLIGWYLPSVLGSETAGIWISSILGGFIFILECYWFPLITTLSIGPLKCLRNAFLLVFLELKRDIVILLIGIGSFLIWRLLFPYSLPFLLLMVFSFTQLAVCVTVNEPMQKRIIEPHTEKSA